MTAKNIEIKAIFTGENRNPIEFISQASNGVQIAPDTAMAPPNFQACSSTPKAATS